MSINQITKMIYSITPKQVMVAVLCISIIVFLYYSFVYEGFSNIDGCNLAKNGSEIARETIIELEKKDVKISRDQINVGYNIRDMQSRDIILGDDSKGWCKTVESEDENVVSEVSKSSKANLYLFDGPGLMDAHEKESLANGIAYAGANDADAGFSKV